MIAGVLEPPRPKSYLGMAMSYKEKSTLLEFSKAFEECVECILHSPLKDNYDHQNTRNTLLHYAVMGKSMDFVTSILKKSPEHVDERNAKGLTPLHIAALLDYCDIATELIKHAIINLKDDYGMTPLLIAAKYGSSKVFEILIKEGARVDDKDRKGKTVLHLAAASNSDNISKILQILKKHTELSKTTHNVEWNTFINMGCSERKSALHYAVIHNRKESVEILLQEGVEINQLDKYDRTALSYAAGKGLLEITKKLVFHGATNWIGDKKGMTPIHYAAKNGRSEVVEVFLEKENALECTEDGRNCLDIAIDGNQEETALVIINSKNWKKFLRNATITEDGEHLTPMRKLISDMPDVAREVFNRCTTLSGTGDKFKVTFDCEFLDDTLLLGHWNGSEDASDIKRNHQYTKDPKEIKRNHPLMIMVSKKRTELLDHPLVSALLKKKWTGIGFILYLLNVCLYVLYLSMLTGFALDVKAPYKFTDVSTDATQDKIPPFAAFAKYSVIVLTAIELIIEVCEMTLMFSDNIGSYFMEKENVLQLIAYILSILFVIHTSGSTDTGYRPEWQWSCGTVSVFLAWINLLLLIQKLDWIGIYVVMLYRVGKVFMKFFLIFSFLIVAFAITFHCLLQNQEQFSTFWISLVKTTEMMIGELDFTMIFLEEKVHYNAITHVFFYIFMLFMTIVVVNLMVGLAVDNIREFQTKAGLNKKEMQVKFALETERLATSWLYRRCLRPVHYQDNQNNASYNVNPVQNEDGGSVGTSSTVQYDQNWNGDAGGTSNTVPDYQNGDGGTVGPSNTEHDDQNEDGGVVGTSNQWTEILEPNKQNWLKKKIGKSWNLTEKDIRQALKARTDGFSKEITKLKREMRNIDSKLTSPWKKEVRKNYTDMEEEIRSMELRLTSKLNTVEETTKSYMQNEMTSMESRLISKLNTEVGTMKDKLEEKMYDIDSKLKTILENTNWTKDIRQEQSTKL